MTGTSNLCNIYVLIRQGWLCKNAPLTEIYSFGLRTSWCQLLLQWAITKHHLLSVSAILYLTLKQKLFSNIFKRTVTIIQSRIHRPKLRNKILIYTFALSFLPDLSGLESTTLVRIVICCMLILIICVQDSKDFADQKPLRITGPPDKVFK